MHFKTYDDTYPDCKSIQSRFSEYLDGILAEEQRRTIHEHLKQCDSCSSELDNLCKTLSILVDYREECLPNSIRNFRLPRSTTIAPSGSSERTRPRSQPIIRPTIPGRPSLVVSLHPRPALGRAINDQT